MEPIKSDLFEPIPGYDGQYEISSNGEVISNKRDIPTVMKNTKNSYGQLSVNLRTPDNKTVKEYVAKLVYEAFGELPKNYNRKDWVVVCKDGDHANLNISNLKVMLKSDHTKSRFEGKNLVTKDNQEDIPSDAILLTDTIYQLNRIQRSKTIEIEPKVSVFREPDLYVKDGKKYKEVEDAHQAFILKQGQYNTDAIADMLDSTYPSLSFGMVKHEPLYFLESNESKRRSYKSIKADCAFILKSGMDAPINAIKISILSIMSRDVEVEKESKLWMLWDDKYHRVTINKYEESNLSPISIRGALSLRLRRDELSSYMEKYIFSKVDSTPRKWYSIPCSVILMHEKFNKPRPSNKHVIGFKDFNFLNLREDNLLWETPGERDERIKEVFPDFDTMRKKVSSQLHHMGLPSDKIKSLVEKYHFLEGKTVFKVSKMISTATDEDYYPRVRYYLTGVKEGKYKAVNPDVRELLESLK